MFGKFKKKCFPASALTGHWLILLSMSVAGIYDKRTFGGGDNEKPTMGTIGNEAKECSTDSLPYKRNCSLIDGVISDFEMAQEMPVLFYPPSHQKQTFIFIQTDHCHRRAFRHNQCGGASCPMRQYPGAEKLREEEPMACFAIGEVAGMGQSAI